MNREAPSDSYLSHEILRDINEKLLIAGVEQHELADVATQDKQRLTALVNGLGAVVCEVSVPAGDVLFLSERVEAFLGYERGQWYRRGFWRRVIHPDDRADALAHLYEAIRSRRDLEHEFRVVAADGRIVWVRNQAVVVSGEGDAASLMRCVITDVSAHKRAEDMLAQSENRYRRVFEAARDGILLLDVDTGVITDANPFVCELLGIPHDGLLGREFGEVGLFAEEGASRAAFDDLRTQHYIRYASLPLPPISGVSRAVELVGNVYVENDATVVQCNLRDVTERRRVEILQAEALERERRITEFLQRPLRSSLSEDAFSGLSLAALYEPAMAEAEVGGDFFDAFVVGRSAGRQCVALCVGDVMGKGLQAAALAGRLKEVLHAFMGEDRDPARTLSRLNNYLCDMGPVDGADFGAGDAPSLAALSLALVDRETCAVTVATAGAEPVAVLRAEGDVEVIAALGLTLGVQRDESFTDAQFVLHPGDILLITTDGLTEARRGKAFLGFDGLLEIALSHAAVASMSAMGQAIVRDARAFGGSFSDDVCLMLARCGE